MASGIAVRGRPGRAALVVLGLLSAFGPLASDMYLPAIPQVIRDLETSNAPGQLTLTVCLAGLGFGQFFWGPASDRFGRKRPLLAGVAMFSLASIACTQAGDVGTLIAFRLIQGLGGSAGIVIGRAIVRDLYDGPNLARVLSRLVIATGSSAIGAPLVGGLLLQVTDWRGIFLTLTVLGMALIAAAWLLVPETGSASRGSKRAAQPRSDWRKMLRERAFRLYAAVFIVGSATLFTYLTFISIVLQDERGVDSLTFALFFAVNAAAIIVGGLFAAAVVRRFGVERVLVVSLCCAAAGATAVLCAAGFGWPIWALQLAMSITMLQQGAIMPLSMALALQPFRSGVGAAAAIAGGLQYLVGGALPWVVAAVVNTSAFTMSATMVACSCTALAIALVGRRRTSQPPAPAS